jgi:hypothetical protein
MGELLEDVGRVFAPDAVEVEEQRVEPRHAMAALVFVPRKRRAVVTEVAGERLQILGGVREPQHFAANEVGDLALAHLGFELLRADEWKLLHNEQIERLTLKLLTNNKVKRKCVEVSD